MEMYHQPSKQVSKIDACIYLSLTSHQNEMYYILVT